MHFATTVFLLCVSVVFVCEITTVKSNDRNITPDEINENIFKEEKLSVSHEKRARRASDTLDDCNCGPKGNCSIVNGKKKCICEKNYAVKDHDVYHEGECHPCECGSDLESKGCIFQGFFGKHCMCQEGYAQRRKQCIRCDCGPKSNCTFNDWEKECTCVKGYAQLDGVCKDCNCGSNGNCSFTDGKKKCVCEKNYAVKNHDVDHENECHPCNCGSEVESSGCLFVGYFAKYCRCNSGYSQRRNQCIKCDCGPHGNCTFDDWTKDCSCEKGYAVLDGDCKECDCGENGECSFLDGVKKCVCDENYSVKDITSEEQQCVYCDCGEGGLGCEFDKIGSRRCQCKSGYVLNFDGRCKDIDECTNRETCPFSTECINTPGSYYCICKTGFQPYKDGKDIQKYGCEDINECLEYGFCPYRDTTECVNLPGSYSCICRKDHSPHSNGSPEAMGCEQDHPQWKTAAIALGVSFIVIILVLFTAFFIKFRYCNRRNRK